MPTFVILRYILLCVSGTHSMLRNRAEIFATVRVAPGTISEPTCTGKSKCRCHLLVKKKKNYNWRCKTGEVRQDTWDRVRELREDNTVDLRCEIEHMREETRGKKVKLMRCKTGDLRAETLFKRQENWDRKCKTWEVRQETKERRQETLWMCRIHETGDRSH